MACAVCGGPCAPHRVFDHQNCVWREVGGPTYFAVVDGRAVPFCSALHASQFLSERTYARNA